MFIEMSRSRLWAMFPCKRFMIQGPVMVAELHSICCSNSLRWAWRPSRFFSKTFAKTMYRYRISMQTDSLYDCEFVVGLVSIVSPTLIDVYYLPSLTLSLSPHISLFHFVVGGPSWKCLGMQQHFLDPESEAFQVMQCPYIMLFPPVDRGMVPFRLLNCKFL